VVLPCAMSNHYHAVIYDRAGRYPEFIEHFHKLLARSQNALRGRWENLCCARRSRTRRTHEVSRNLVKCPSRRWTCPARRSEPAGTECCVTSGDAGHEAYTGSAKPCDRASKDPEGPATVGRSLEPSSVIKGDGDVEASLRERSRSNRGPRATAHAHGGTRKPGRPRCFHRRCGMDNPLIKSWRCERVRDAASEPNVPTVIPRIEGNEVTRDEQRGVGAPHSTDEAGEPTRGTPWREGDTSRA
jgi:hypothetical protein